MSTQTTIVNNKKYTYRDKYTSPITETLRYVKIKKVCLKCEKKFKSISHANRLCDICRVRNQQKITSFLFEY